MGRKKGGGGKLSRSEVMQTRMSPKLRLAAETLSRIQHRTISNLIEVLIDEATEKNKIPVVQSHNAQIDVNLFGKIKAQKLTVKEAIDKIWSAEEADRFAKFALFLPELLVHEESHVWQLITEIPYFWEHFEINLETKSGKLIEKEPWALVNHKGLIYENLREHWPLINAVLEGTEKPELLKALKKLPPGRIVKRPDDYPYPIKKVSNSHD